MQGDKWPGTDRDLPRGGKMPMSRIRINSFSSFFFFAKFTERDAARERVTAEVETNHVKNKQRRKMFKMPPVPEICHYVEWMNKTCHLFISPSPFFLFCFVLFVREKFPPSALCRTCMTC